MKQSDVFTILIVAVVGTIAAYFGVNALLGDPNKQSVSFNTIDDITATLSAPDSELFNPDAINPTVEVYVGDCEDVDQNGILSTEEMIACGKITEEDVEKTEVKYCADGTSVLDASTCPENKEKNSSNSSNNSSSTNNGDVTDCGPDGKLTDCAAIKDSDDSEE